MFNIQFAKKSFNMGRSTLITASLGPKGLKLIHGSTKFLEKTEKEEQHILKNTKKIE
jgi:hypothetical protein